MKSKYYGQIIDGKWKVIDYKNRYYKLINIYNNQVVEINHASLLNIIKGKTSVSRIISLKLHKNKIGYAFTKIPRRFYK